jgi:hypothetical protein
MSVAGLGITTSIAKTSSTIDFHAHRPAGGITAEMVAVIEATVEIFLGTKARILSIRMLDQSDGDSSAWASQGRDMVQSSHNLVQRGH